MAVDNVVALSEELGVHRRLLYKWRQQLKPPEPDGYRDPRYAGVDADEGDLSAEASLGKKVQEVDFFQRCLANSRGSTPGQRKHWREGIYDRIREVMPMQGN